MKLIKFIFFYFFLTSIYGQPNIKNQLFIENGFDDIQLDIHGFLYQVKGDALVKRDLSGKEIYRYSNKLLGDIAQLDVSNPLRPLLFYKDQGVIAVLDNTLSQQKQIISLNEIGLYQANSVANSNFDNGIWLFDVDVNEILKINANAAVTYRSGNLAVILPDITSPVIALYEKNKLLYAVTNEEVFVLDQFGALLKILKIKATNGFIENEGVIYCFDNEFLKAHEIMNFYTDTIFQTNKYQFIRGNSEYIIGLLKDKKHLDFIEIH